MPLGPDMTALLAGVARQVARDTRTLELLSRQVQSQPGDYTQASAALHATRPSLQHCFRHLANCSLTIRSSLHHLYRLKAMDGGQSGEVADGTEDVPS